MREFQDKVAVVTGAASGMGRAMADRFAAEGMKVVLADVEEEALARAEREIRASEADVVAVRTDVSKLADIEALAQRAMERFGAVHVLCNNAGVGTGGFAWEQTQRDWDWVLGVDLMGVVYGIRTFLPLMLAHGDEGHIVNTASVAGLTSVPFMAPYAVAKHGVVALSESLYHELRMIQSKVHVTVLCPGLVNTRIMESNRNRPADLVNPGAPPPPPAGEDADPLSLASRLKTDGLPPATVADQVLQAMRDEQLYLLTDHVWDERIAERHRGIETRANPTPAALV